MNNKIGQCLAHGSRLDDFMKEVICFKSQISLRFNASTWHRCKEHGPADELREFVLELPDSFDDNKLSVCIEETAEK